MSPRENVRPPSASGTARRRGAVLRGSRPGARGRAYGDWGPGGASPRYYGRNGHGDVVYTMDANGSVTATNRLDPWGVPLGPTPAGFPEWRFQGSWHDAATDLSWVVARWYAPRLGTFTSEDPRAGEPQSPSSRQLYVYGAGDPVDRSDPSGQVSKTLAVRYRKTGSHDYVYDTKWHTDWLETWAGFKYAKASIRWSGTLHYDPSQCSARQLASKPQLSIDMLMDGSLRSESTITLTFASGHTMKVLQADDNDNYGWFSVCVSGCSATYLNTSLTWGIVTEASLVASAYFTMREYNETVVAITNSYRIIFIRPVSKPKPL